MFCWLHTGIERVVRSRSSRQGKVLKHLPLWYIRTLREAKLVHMLRYVYKRSPAQREAWNKAGVKLRDIRSPKILEHIPFTTGAELAEHAGDYYCVDPAEFVHLLTTSSTTGIEKTIYFTADDFNHQVRMMGTSLQRFPGSTRAMALFQVHDPTWSVGTMVRRAIAEAGMLGFLSGVHRSVEDQIELIKKYRINCLITSPVQLGRLTWDSKCDVGELGVRYVHLGAQPWSEDFRRRMEQAWGATLLDGYGNNECGCGVASECLEQNGLHVSEADYWLEVVDTKTGEAVPDGQDGELLITTLSRRGMPLVRYRTGDWGRLLERDGRCGCGIGLRKMGRVSGRVDDMLIVGAGNNLYPAELNEAMFSVSGVTDYQFVIEKDGYKDVLDVTVEAGRSATEVREKILQALMGVQAIGRACQMGQTMEIRKIEVVRPGSLSAGRPKSVRIIDKREAGVVVGESRER